MVDATSNIYLMSTKSWSQFRPQELTGVSFSRQETLRRSLSYLGIKELDSGKDLKILLEYNPL